MADLAVRITGSASQFEREMKKVQASAKGLANFGSIGQRIVAGFSAAALVAEFSAIVNKLDQIDDMSKRLKISPEFFQVIQYGAKMAGVSSDSIIVSLQRLNIAISENDRAFKRIGLSAKELKNFTNEEKIKKVAVALMNVKNESQRTAYAQKLLGKGAYEILPVMLEIDKYAAEAKAAGQIFSKEDIEAAGKVADNIERIKVLGQKGILLSGLMQDLATSLEIINQMNQIVTKMTARPEAGKTGEAESGFSWKKGIAKGIASVMPGIGPMSELGDMRVLQKGLLDIFTVLNSRLPGGMAQGEPTK